MKTYFTRLETEPMSYIRLNILEVKYLYVVERYILAIIKFVCMYWWGLEMKSDDFHWTLLIYGWFIFYNVHEHKK